MKTEIAGEAMEAALQNFEEFLFEDFLSGSPIRFLGVLRYEAGVNGGTAHVERFGMVACEPIHL